MTSLSASPIPDRPAAPPAFHRPSLQVLPTAPAAPDRADYESMSIPDLCRVILAADSSRRR